MIFIKTKKELCDYIEADKRNYIRDSFKERLTDILLGRENYRIYKFVKTMRYVQYYSYKKELISTEDYYEIRDMFVPFGISITQTKLGKKELFDEFNEYINGREDSDKICVLKKIGKIQDVFDGNVDDSYNENFFESVYFDEFDNE